MAKPVTLTQLSYLYWLYKGNKIEICPQATQIAYSSEPSFNTDIRALENLNKSGMLALHHEVTYGLVFIVITISDKGIQCLEERSWI